MRFVWYVVNLIGDIGAWNDEIGRVRIEMVLAQKGVGPTDPWNHEGVGISIRQRTLPKDYNDGPNYGIYCMGLKLFYLSHVWQLYGIIPIKLLKDNWLSWTL